MKYIFKVKKQSIRTGEWHTLQTCLMRSDEAWTKLNGVSVNPTELMNRLSQESKLNIVVAERVMYSFTRVEPEILK